MSVMQGTFSCFADPSSSQGVVSPEKDHVLLILNLLRRMIPPPSADSGSAHPPRLATYLSLLLAHSMRCVFYPQNIHYPIIMRFLLHRPDLDTRNMPMLYTSLYSSSDDWRRERNWIVRFLADGTNNTADWSMFKKKHTWDILATLFQESMHEPGLRLMILQVCGRNKVFALSAQQNTHP